jgi:hypothetical protein
MNAIWNGTPSEYLELVCILDRNCECEQGMTPCGAHALRDDQRALNGLLYGRRLAAQFGYEEWLTHAPTRRLAQATRRVA